jgi:hypothetical protein
MSASGDRLGMNSPTVPAERSAPAPVHNHPRSPQQIPDRQAVRTRRFLLASSVYAVCLPLLYFAYVIEFIAARPAVVTMLLAIAANLLLYIAFRTGFNLRFKDPSLTWHQTDYAVLIDAIESLGRPDPVLTR